jgi:putative SOS response-associated peptidase YedK
MCNLYSMTASVDELRKLFGPFVGDTANLPSFEEIYPGRPAPVLRREEGGRLRLELMEWGVPGPAAAGGRPVTNVRNLASPFWRNMLNRTDRRCIVPVTRFCEWEGEKGSKRKIWFGLHEDVHPLFAFAGLWRPGEGGVGHMAFLTCEPNSVVGAVHPKAMPVMLRTTDVPRWLESETVTACELAVPYADADMRRLP